MTAKDKVQAMSKKERFFTFLFCLARNIDTTKSERTAIKSIIAMKDVSLLDRLLRLKLYRCFRKICHLTNRAQLQSTWFLNFCVHNCAFGKTDFYIHEIRRHTGPSRNSGF